MAENVRRHFVIEKLLKEIDSALAWTNGNCMPTLFDNDQYEFVKDIDSSNFVIAMAYARQSRELVAVKCIERGVKTDENVK
jgi:hypothetical protein